MNISPTSHLSLAGQHLHFMGIGGIGMSALAELALTRGARVSGCDREESDNTRRLRRRGIEVMIGHDPRHAAGADLLVYSSAIAVDHPERLAAADRAMRRGIFLAQALSGLKTIGVCGTHGKTTTSWLIARLFLAAGRDPLILLGGVAREIDGNFRPGKELAVVELDESDESFLEPQLAVAVITNVESDHLHHYGSFMRLRAAFQRFAAGAADGALIASADDGEAAAIYAAHRGRKISFGLSAAAMVRGEDLGFRDGWQRFAVEAEGERHCMDMRLPAAHNIRNALAAIAAARACQVEWPAIKEGLAACEGVERRMQRLADREGVAIYTDYAHHPTEIRASLAAARAWHRGRILVAYQPHLYSRTRDYAAEFGRALAEADEVVVCDIYPAREEPLPGVSAALIVDAIRAAGGKAVGPLGVAQIPAEIAARCRGFAAVVLMGAGDIGKAEHALLERLSGAH